MTSYAGLDASLAQTSVCVIDGSGNPRFEGRLASQPEASIRWLTKDAADAARIGLEIGQGAGILFRALKAAGLPVLCLETRAAVTLGWPRLRSLMLRRTPDLGTNIVPGG